MPALSHLACYFASFDSLSSCPRIRLAEKGPNTALYYYLTPMKLVMYAAEENLKAFPVRVIGECLVNVGFIYSLLETEMQLWFDLVLRC